MRILTFRLLQLLAPSPPQLLSREFAVPVLYHSQLGGHHFDADDHNCDGDGNGKGDGNVYGNGDSNNNDRI